MSKASCPPFRQFFHFVNSDLSMDSICGFCLLTAAWAPNEADLRARELSHPCLPRKGSALSPSPRQPSDDYSIVPRD
jgi:hypothetical protein